MLWSGQMGKAGSMNEPGTDYPVIYPLDIERGAVCMDCHRPFRPGDRYATRLIGVVDDVPLTETICLWCDQALV